MGEPHASGFTNDLNDKNANATSVRLELQKILQSQGFRSSRRSRDFLRYVVERTLDGHAESFNTFSTFATTINPYNWPETGTLGPNTKIWYSTHGYPIFRDDTP